MPDDRWSPHGRGACVALAQRLNDTSLTFADEDPRTDRAEAAAAQIGGAHISRLRNTGRRAGSLKRGKIRTGPPHHYDVDRQTQSTHEALTRHVFLSRSWTSSRLVLRCNTNRLI